MEEQKHYVIVDNETYELYDGNGSFYVTKANHSTETFSLQNAFCSPKESSKNILTNFSLPLSSSNPNVSSQIGQALEPIIIDDYTNMNYFTQAASDVTIYLNADNDNNFTDNANHQSDYLTNSDGVIDLTKLANDSDRVSRTSIADDTCNVLNLNKTVESILNDELDAPEYIDISKLKFPILSGMVQNEVIPLITVKNSPKKNCNKGEEQANTETDDEVIFVKEFKACDKENTVKPLDLRSKGDAGQKTIPEPRRNPKRKVQLMKESFDLALKLSDEEIYCGKPSRSSWDFCLKENSRRSHNTGAALSHPIAINKKNYRDWPTNGLHERPVFNMATKKIEKFDIKSHEDKRKTSLKKNDTNSLKVSNGKKPVTKGKRRIPNKTKITKESPEKGISKEFASLTHDTLQVVINYVLQVREYNEIVKGNAKEEKPREETGSLIGDAQSLLNVVCSNNMEKNLSSAVDLLTDSCVLYSLANNVCQSSVSKYLNSVK